MNDIKTIAKKIFSLINLKKDLDYQDPDYEMIETEIKRIPEEEIKNFYMHLVKNREYSTQTGILIRNRLEEAVNNFIEIISQKVWKENKLKEKSKLLTQKVFSVELLTRELSAEREKKFYDRGLEEVEYRENGTLKKLLNDEEIDVLEIAGVESLVSKASFMGTREIQEIIEKHYKTYFTKKLFEQDDTEKIEFYDRGFELPEPKRF